MRRQPTAAATIQIALFLVPSLALAEDSVVKTAAESAKLGVEFRSELLYSDHGLEKVDGAAAPDATTELQVQKLKVKLAGNINKKTEYKFRFNLLDGHLKGPLDYGYGTHWFTDMIAMGIGKQKVLQGGWDNLDNNYRSHVQGAYAQNLAFHNYEDMITLHVKAAGKVSLQLLNDVSHSHAEWNVKGEHPTFILGWEGAFGNISPLLDYGSYDNNKSNWIDAGVKMDMAGASLGLDYMMHNRTHKHTLASDGKAKEVADAATSITFKAAYELKGTATPWLYVSTYDNKQGTATDTTTPVAKDSKVNYVDPATGEKSFDDNGMTWGVGADVSMLGNGWTPYLAVVNKSGKFPEGTEEKTKSEMNVKLGILGSF